jgi:hypothetical protein
VGGRGGCVWLGQVSENPGRVDMMRKNRIREKRGDGGGVEGAGDVPKKRNINNLGQNRGT